MDDIEVESDPPYDVLLGSIDYTLRHAGAWIDAEIALNLLCQKLGVDRTKLEYKRGWAKKYL